MLIPPSVAAYVHDNGLRRAVRELVDLGPRNILTGLTWDELPRLYRAQLAAAQVQADWGVFAIGVWNAVWGGLLDDWKPLSPDEQIVESDDALPTLASMLDTTNDGLWFGRLFHGRSHVLYASLSAVPSRGLALFTACERNGRGIDFQEIGATADEYGNWISNLALRLDAADLDVGPLRAIAETAVAVADERTAPRTRTGN